ncbi:hypothetical protein SAMD00019534_087820 [Acytostelium subglobosum LB1]|uniref:hypothetical protein n=1 Tax=Acytostelium subglobosum LB1 TaxID=1410327 RepID=UPI000644D9D1|nr:hypothetical protein SAMD00019534_087820 [Acytostelium subglobosum LB1]GAM25607.1 hypothetical protein SAMD00019534_087820 [Acytostelium subglobosum LB1]|eukprot:XP_012751593.1 hypothetical protein SAMD00019534_087820 [Acytostelium subglobosum LB1]
MSTTESNNINISNTPMTTQQPSVYCSLSPLLLKNTHIDSHTTIVIIDVLRATSTIATALSSGATRVKAVAEVSECIELVKQLGEDRAIAAGEREGRVAPGLLHGNSPLEYPAELVRDKTLVLTTTNGTKLLTMAIAHGPGEILTGAFVNLSAVVSHLIAKRNNVVLACAGWRDAMCLEDTMFAGAVINALRSSNIGFNIQCDSAQAAESIYLAAMGVAMSSTNPIYQYLQVAEHFKRLSKLGCDKDLEYCLSLDRVSVLPILNSNDGYLYPH